MTRPSCPQCHEKEYYLIECVNGKWIRRCWACGIQQDMAQDEIDGMLSGKGAE